MTTFDETRFVQRICQRLDQSLEGLDQYIETRLDTARRQALAQHEMSGAGMAEAARQALGQEQPLSTDIESRLDGIRRQAVARLQEKQQLQQQRWFSLEHLFQNRPLATGMVTAAFVLVTSVSLLQINDPSETLSIEDELTLVASAEDIELYENLDFYLWLAENGFDNQM